MSLGAAVSALCALLSSHTYLCPCNCLYLFYDNINDDDNDDDDCPWNDLQSVM